jgi:hypothetical protein
MATSAPSPSWSVFDRRTRTMTPRAGSKVRSLDVEGDELGPTERAAEPHQDQGAVPGAPQRPKRQGRDHGPDGVAGERSGAALGRAMGATDALPDGTDLGVGGWVGEPGVEVRRADGRKPQS